MPRVWYMMIHTLSVFLLSCIIIRATSAVQQHTINFMFVPPHYSSGAPNGCSSPTSKIPPLNLFAIQDKISGLGLGLGLQWDDSNNNVQSQRNNINGNIGEKQQPQQQRVPFIIQRIGRGEKSEIEEITNMCIDVFFNEQKNAEQVSDQATNKKRMAPWKAIQLAYLNNMQRSDILARNVFKQDQLVDLVVARRVYPVEDTSQINEDGNNLIDDIREIYNIEQLTESSTNGGMYITGEVIGYCEVSEKNFGLGAVGNYNNEKKPSSTKKKRQRPGGEKPRPYLSNLSVVAYARQSGIGSKLMDACEDAVRSWNAGHREIVLQVEEDNPTAIQFYKRRGYKFVFADPTCRRFDTSGFVLKETRITKYAMVKKLDTSVNGSGSNGAGRYDASSFVEKLRNSFFVQ